MSRLKIYVVCCCAWKLEQDLFALVFVQHFVLIYWILCRILILLDCGGIRKLLMDLIQYLSMIKLCNLVYNHLNYASIYEPQPGYFTCKFYLEDV